MKLIKQSPKKAIKAFLKQRPLESERDLFKKNLIGLIDKIAIIESMQKEESEEHLKNDIRDFLRDTFYKDTNAINTKDRKDLVIHSEKDTNSDVRVIIEAKRPSNVVEMITADNPNKKALWELILYYLNERNESPGSELKYLIATNIYEWYIIDANYFDKYIYRNTQIKKLYETKKRDDKDNPWFYEEIPKIVSTINIDIPSVYFDIRDYDKILRNPNSEDDKELVALYKILSPQHLINSNATPNDNNTLNERFYKELLHIIGLEEAREGSKNVIRRKTVNRNTASLIELTIEALKSEDIFHHIPDIKIYGENKEIQTFNIALELCITWINRVLFLKLLEGQLVSYHKGDKNYCFLNSKIINNYDDLFDLFHKVLAVNIPDRVEDIKIKYKLVPYLNSSLFEISELEDQTIKINSLGNTGQLELINTTILKEIKKNINKLPSLEYFLSFLNSYDFASEGEEDWQKENKQLINASVLGKVFEKINGYKDGSIFTPAFITMYMCRKSILPTVIEKFKVAKKWEIETIEELYNKIEDKKEANTILNSIKICDPAVGSGHFLVSALNELIAIKSELGILMDENGKTLRDYEIEVVNDELLITDENGNIFQYNPKNIESNRIQKTLFHEKQTIIENCLFGVDINPKSVLICRLRLWIELLKNAYYREIEYSDLETLPNIDINIKCGNSLLQRFALDADMGKALKNTKYDIKAYRGFVNEYKNEKNREAKRNLQKIIDSIKGDFRTEIFKDDPKVIRLSKLKGEQFNLLNQIKLFEENAKQKKDRKEKQKKLEIDIEKLKKEIDDIKTNAVYKNAFEWRFEFPEVLNNDGDFEGFDLIIGNPPYIKEYENKDAFNGLRNLECYQGKMDIWYLFGDLGLKLLKIDNYLCYIATNNWVTNAGASKYRNIIIKNCQIMNLIDFGAYMIFENASIQTMIMLFKNNKTIDNYTFDYRRLSEGKHNLQDVMNLLEEKENSNFLSPVLLKSNMIDKSLIFNNDEISCLTDKIKSKHNFFLREKAIKKLGIKSEIANGIHHHHDIVNKDRKELLFNKYEVGTGIFVLNKVEVEKLNLSQKEMELIKPQYSSKQVLKYYTNPKNEDWVIYTKSDINKPDKITKEIPLTNYPNIKQHLDNFQSVITSSFGPYGLHRAREQHFFEGEKIAVLRKCSKEPIFSYSDFECYLPAAFYIIQSDRINMKYLTGLLNSKLIEFWLRKQGKMQGNNYQLDKEPLLEIPIYNPPDKEVNEIAELVNRILLIKQQGGDSSHEEKEIDDLVYKLYEITPEERGII